jgi:hypothetical protein
MLFTATLVGIALLMSSEKVRRAVPSDSMVTLALVTILVLALFQMGRLG